MKSTTRGRSNKNAPVALSAGRVNAISLVSTLLLGLILLAAGATAGNSAPPAAGDLRQARGSETADAERYLVPQRFVDELPDNAEVIHVYDGGLLVDASRLPRDVLLYSSRLENRQIMSYRSWRGSVTDGDADRVARNARDGYFLISLAGPLDPSWRHLIERAGLKYVDHAHPYGMLVRANGKAVVRAARTLTTTEGFPLIEGGLPLPRESRLGRDIAEWIRDGGHPREFGFRHQGGEALVRVIAHADVDPEKIDEEIRGFLEAGPEHSPRLQPGQFRGDTQSIERLLSNVEGVAHIHAEYPKQLLNNLAAKDYMINVEPVWNDPSLGFTGDGVIVGVNDSGMDLSHPDFPSGSVHAFLGTTSNTDNAHGTHVTGSVAGRGAAPSPTNTSGCGDITSPLGDARGMAWEALITHNNIFDGGSTTETGMMQWHSQQGALLTNNSWGYAAYSYASNTADIDVAVRDADPSSSLNQTMTIVFAAGNDGPGSGTVGTPGNAKNAITVGASQNDRCGSYVPNNCSGPNIDSMACFSSRGPAQQRIKPDVVAPGADIVSTESADPQATNGWEQGWTGSEYAIMPGTSMASPLVTGAATVFYQFYNFEFGSWPSPALVRAAFINGATDMGMGYPSFDQGWGRINLRHTLEGPPGGDVAFFDQGDVDHLSTGQTWTDAFNVASGSVPLKITLTWTDPPGASGCDPCHINDLNLIVTAPDGTVFRGNQFNGAWSQANATGSDNLNNAENVFVQTPQAGEWQIQVTSASTSQNPPNLSGQDFAAVYSGDLGVACTDPAAPSTLTATADADNQVSLSWTGVTADSYNIYRSETPGGPFTQIDSGVAATSYTDTGLSAGETFYYEVTAFNEPSCESTPSNEDSATVTGFVCGDLGAPTGLNATAPSAGQVDLNWNSVTDADSYRVYRATASGGPYTQIASGIAATSYSDTDVEGGVEYHYVVTAYHNGAGCESPQSSEVSIYATGDCSVAPSFDGIQSVAPTSGSCALRASWTAGTSNCPGGEPLVYNVYRSTNPAFTPDQSNLIASCVTEEYFDDASASTGTEYHYIVQAEDATGAGGGSCASGNQEGNQVAASGTLSVGGELYSNDFESGSGLDDWVTGTFYAGAPTASWRGVQSCSANSGSNVFRFGGSSCTTDYGTDYFTFAEPGGGSGIDVPSGSNSVKLAFSHRHEMETSYDGLTLAVSLDGSSYTLVAGSALSAGPAYDGGLSDFCAPDGAAGMPVWTGSRSSFVDTEVDLDAVCDAISGGSGGCAGQNVHVAFTAITDCSVTDAGWFIDDVVVSSESSGSCDIGGTPPKPADHLTVTSEDGKNTLEWINPGSGYNNAVIRMRTDTYPTGPQDGTLVATVTGGVGARDSYEHTGLSNGTTYYYGVFVDNGNSEYSPGQFNQGRPMDTTGPVKWAYSTGATAMTPPSVRSAIYGTANDRVLHGMASGAGTWPGTWNPHVMNRSVQSRSPVVPNAIGGATVIFLASQDGRVYAVDADSGSQIWTSPQLGDMLQGSVSAMFTQFGGSVDRVFAGTRNSVGDNAFYGLNLGNGSVDWSFDNGGGANAIGIIGGGSTVDYTNGRVYFSSRAHSSGSNNTVWALDVSDGSLVWSAAVGDVDSAPIMRNGVVYVGTNDSRVVALDANSGNEMWTFEASDGPVKGYIWRSGDGNLYFATTNTMWALESTGNELWSQSVPSPSIPLVLSDSVVAGAGDSRLYQLDRSTGNVTGSVILGDGGASIGSPAYNMASSHIKVGSDSGVIYAVEFPISIQE